ncbi:MAG: hypothetical protein M1812_001048 [Candelaria pacifica]|nr:MAG: hypothetical protein M1812_001048 [Candelaria pacifica]
MDHSPAATASLLPGSRRSRAPLNPSNFQHPHVIYYKYYKYQHNSTTKEQILKFTLKEPSLTAKYLSKEIFKMYDPTKRPYKDKSISELAHLFNDKCLATKRLGSAGASYTFNDNEDDEKLPSTFLKDPASSSAIDDIQAKMRAEPYNFPDGLPEDYIEFLKVTNGIYAFDHADSNDEIFRPVEKLEFEDGFMPLELLPMGVLSSDIEVDWPEPDWGLQLGAGGDEGTHHLYPPHTIKAAIDALDKVYKKAKKDDKKKIEKAAKDLFGGMNQLRKTTCVVFRMYHWAAEVEIFPTFKALLEDFVQGMDEEEEKMKKEKEEEKGNVGKEKANNNGETSKAQKSKSNTTTKDRKSIPEGKPNSLTDLKLIFTGTFDTMDRNTSKATTEKYGGRVISKLEDADYVVLGIQAGPKKLQTIKSKNLPTINEEGFFKLLQGDKPSETQDDLDNQSTKAMPPKDSNGARKKTAEGKENSLKGVKLMFTGTLETMDRATSKKTAEKFGAKVVSKLEGTDFIVLGTGAGPKKLEEIEKKGLKTVSEKEFQDMLESGEGVVGDEDGDEAEKEKEEKEEEEEKPKAKGKGKKRAEPTPGTRSSKRTRKE